jgi:hypothetical protein
MIIKSLRGKQKAKIIRGISLSVAPRNLRLRFCANSSPRVTDSLIQDHIDLGKLVCIYYLFRNFLVRSGSPLCY